ncbi:MAG: FtsW/RodA/SpoVE family cell cycle protein [Verrucomicrobiales bacterium]
MNELFRRILFHTHWLLVALVIGLGILGVIVIDTATFNRTGQWENLTSLPGRQSIWLLAGLGIFFVFSYIPHRWWIDRLYGAVGVYLVGLVLLVATRIFGKDVSGARRLLDLGPFDIQASQVAILGGILLLAYVLSNERFRLLHPFFRVCLAGAIVGGPFLLVLTQPDLGSSLVWIPIFLGMLFISGIPKRYLVLMLVAGFGICAPLTIAFVLKPYQMSRLIIYQNPDLDPQGDGYALNRSLEAIGSAGSWGKGLRAEDSQTGLGLVPVTVSPTDYIFTVAAESLGFVGGTTIIVTFSLLLLFLVSIALGASRYQEGALGCLLVTGVSLWIFTHVFLNIGMTMSVVPITGLPLPLLSYGGSFLFSIMLGLGIAHNVHITRQGELHALRELRRSSFGRSGLDVPSRYTGALTR